MPTINQLCRFGRNKIKAKPKSPAKRRDADCNQAARRDSIGAEGRAASTVAPRRRDARDLAAGDEHAGRRRLDSARPLGRR